MEERDWSFSACYMSLSCSTAVLPSERDGFVPLYLRGKFKSATQKACLSRHNQEEGQSRHCWTWCLIGSSIEVYSMLLLGIRNRGWPHAVR
ncbi:hypothetical protein K402DRAFT_212010 [Aulographum hederae CBS 113979]|uniref:Uncharacterized protein n=1 Tax=Aulographum hederae CBS 113979 TaxID=1176131 RepID=A0A6G1GN35_9PEZI|nr:hypothetical protein K402DRAFT_212010 [Aulographum hederae CBS 113979]